MKIKSCAKSCVLELDVIVFELLVLQIGCVTRGSLIYTD